MRIGDCMCHKSDDVAHRIEEVREFRVVTSCGIVYDSDEMEHNQGRNGLCTRCAQAVERRRRGHIVPGCREPQGRLL